jgi:hypothetical protein
VRPAQELRSTPASRWQTENGTIALPQNRTIQVEPVVSVPHCQDIVIFNATTYHQPVQRYKDINVCLFLVTCHQLAGVRQPFGKALWAWASSIDRYVAVEKLTFRWASPSSQMVSQM